MSSSKTKKIIISAMFASIITVLTAYFHINIGTNSGYVHFGDSMIYLAACLLPAPYAMCAASIGGAMADMLSGSAIWAFPTAIIKAHNVIPFSIMLKYIKNRKDTRIINLRIMMMSVISGLITSIGYMFAEAIMFGSIKVAAASLIFGLIQAAGSTVIFYFAGTALDTVKFKSKILN
mgnify:FL=1